MPIYESTLTVTILYVSAMLLGLTARQKRRSFGRWHHILFACTCLAFLWSLLQAPSVAHAPLALVLTLLPLTRPRSSRRHDLLALVGAISLLVLIALQ